ncbi:unnamed protein product [Brugia timori]|uniref:Uncharacterized protein n=1 Tax=Brugia timori TaxID=42155 RepID=A0A3P7WGI6_9BILA|nr:unnamed protein product [Brugia timori]
MTQVSGCFSSNVIMASFSDCLSNSSKVGFSIHPGKLVLYKFKLKKE